jgi:uncharacterized protein (DUF697 family)
MAITKGTESAGIDTAETNIAEKKAQIGETIDSEMFASEKLSIYKDFVSGKITRGALDRKMDVLYAKKQRVLVAATPHAPETPRQPEAEDIIHRYMWWSAGGGLLPIPVVDFLALGTIQVLMVRDLCDLYEVPFTDQWGKTAVSAVVGGSVSSYLKAVPGFGTLVGIITGPAFFSASTYAVGKVFTQHFESGGTLLTFDPAKMKQYFRDYFEAGKTVARAPASN